MLNKDEYNQEEYNDYYRQEVEGSELGGDSEKEGSNKILLLLGILALGAAGYFGYTSMNNPSINDEELKVIQPPISTQIQEIEETNEVVQKSIIEEKIEVIKPIKAISTVAKTVQKETNEQMSPEEIAKVVAVVMQQMKSNQPIEKKTSSSSIVDDNDLMNALAGTEIESINTTKHINLSKADKVKDHTINNNNQITTNTYNKVNVQNISGSDELSQLSNQISSEINSNEGISSTVVMTNKEDKEYSTNIKKEVIFREKEMRVIVVKQGDTLGKIAKRAYGNVMAFKKIFEANPDVLKRPDRIHIGQRLRIPE